MCASRSATVQPSQGVARERSASVTVRTWASVPCIASWNSSRWSIRRVWQRPSEHRKGGVTSPYVNANIEPMRVAMLHGVGDIRVEEAPNPDVPEGYTLVRVTDVGLCGSDLHWFGEGGIGDATLTRPTVPGHEFAGVGASGDLDGVPVAVDPAIACGRCEMCEAGHRNLCVNIQFAGHSTLDGGMAELIA